MGSGSGRRGLALFAMAACFAATSSIAFGDPVTDSSAAPGWWGDIKFSGHLEAGFRGNPDSPKDGLNFGDLLADRANTLTLNQLALIAARDLDPDDPGLQLGFRFQALYGADAHLLHIFNEWDRAISGRNQIAFPEANLQLHLPVLTRYGADVRIGQFEGIEGVEGYDPTQDFFYTHSYISNFAVPHTQTGALATIHVNPILYIYAGIDTGVNAGLGRKGDNNSAPSYQTGAQLNLPFGVTVYLTSHIGPELPGNTPQIHANSALRYYNDIDIVWNIDGSLTSMTDLNYLRDDGLNASAEGVAQYLTYTIGDALSIGGRAEFWRDDTGVFAYGAPGSLDIGNSMRGLASRAYPVGKSGYFEATAGLNYKIPGLPKAVSGTTLRPEIRWDHAFGTKAFDAETKQNQITLAADLVVPF